LLPKEHPGSLLPKEHPGSLLPEKTQYLQFLNTPQKTKPSGKPEGLLL